MIGIFATSSDTLGAGAAVVQQTGSTGAPSYSTATGANAKTFYLFNANHDGVNETMLGIAPDTYSPETLTVNAGETVVIHFYNVDTTDRHSLEAVEKNHETLGIKCEWITEVKTTA